MPMPMPFTTPLQLTSTTLHRAVRKLSNAAGTTRSVAGTARLRFAPSPTGHLHLGGLRTALFNHLLARKLKGRWVLRIEDTDRSRLVPGATESIIKTLLWAKLDFDEGPSRPGGTCGPYVQSHRQPIYHLHRDRLLKSKDAYRCFCSPGRLNEMREDFKKNGSNLTYDRRCLQLSEAESSELALSQPYVIRLKNPDSPVSVDDLVYGKLKFLNDTQDDVILVKADGTPTYHFANVVDDHLMGITHVLRGEEWLSSTPKHILLYRALGFDPPKFAHLPLLVNADGSKLSKRSGDVRVEDYIVGWVFGYTLRNSANIDWFTQLKGYEPEALLNFTALMGMNHVRNGAAKDENTNSDVMTMDEMISVFSIESISKHRSKMSQAKLDHLNQQHIAKSLVSKDPERVRPWIERAKSVLLTSPNNSPSAVSDHYVQRVLLTIKDRLHVFSDVKYLAEYFFRLPDLYTTEARELKQTIPDEVYREVLSTVHDELSSLPDEEPEFTKQAVASRLKSVSQLHPRVTSKQLMTSLRHAITGRKIGPGMAESIQVMGKHRTLERITAALAIP